MMSILKTALNGSVDLELTYRPSSVEAATETDTAPVEVEITPDFWTRYEFEQLLSAI